MIKQEGKLIVFEGVDATGKTTLRNELCSRLQNENIEYRTLHFPGDEKGTLGELVYRIHHNYRSEFKVEAINPCSLQLLHVAAHIDMIKGTIRTALDNGEFVILDRFWWSTYVYGLNGGVLRNELELMIRLEKEVWVSILPDILFLVECDAPLRSDEVETKDWHAKRKLYQELANDEKTSYKVVSLITEKNEEVQRLICNRIWDEIIQLD